MVEDYPLPSTYKGTKKLRHMQVTHNLCVEKKCPYVDKIYLNVDKKGQYFARILQVAAHTTMKNTHTQP